jgi:hypothetical protein
MAGPRAAEIQAYLEEHALEALIKARCTRMRTRE